jgi:hypothetical protein
MTMLRRHWAYYLVMTFVIALTILRGILAIGGIAVARVDRRALSRARGAKAEASV